MGMRIPALMRKGGVSNLALLNYNYNNNNKVAFGDEEVVRNVKVLKKAGGEKEKEKVVVVMGVTGSGKSRLSIDLATHFDSEIINSDKMQLYQGLDIVTNKITPDEQRGVPHHLLGITTPTPYLDFHVSKFCSMATLAADSIVRRGRLPIIVGGSNSYIEALVDHNFMFRSKYECCFLWVDVRMPLLHSFVSDRVDNMVASGLVEEVNNLFDPNNADYSQGIRKAIGVPELHRYLRLRHSTSSAFNYNLDDNLLQQAIAEIKENTCNLACRQMDKIHRLRNVKGWNLHRLDATEAFRKKRKQADHAWYNHVARPSTTIVAHFLTQTQPNLKPTPFRMPSKRVAASAR